MEIYNHKIVNFIIYTFYMQFKFETDHSVNIK